MEAVRQAIDTKLALYHAKVENRINQLLAYITKCFKDHETIARSVIQKTYAERQKESSDKGMSEVERYAKTSLRDFRKERAAGLGELNKTFRKDLDTV
eukprot:4714358-Lingulodinium_polyedra.AAC.1